MQSDFCITVTLEGDQTFNLFAQREQPARIACNLLSKFTAGVVKVTLLDPKGKQIGDWLGTRERGAH